MTACGVVLAAGAGTRFGGPKALARDADGTPWLARAVGALRRGGCDDVVVVLGAEAPTARSLVPPTARTVVAQQWRDGLARAVYARDPGHPVVVGADRVPGLLASLRGDQGAREYLQRNGVASVECGDLFSGADVDQAAWSARGSDRPIQERSRS